MRRARALAMMVAAIASFGSGALLLSGLARADVAATKPNPDHLELVMSQDDSICRPITAVYDRLFRAFLKKHKDDQLPGPTDEHPLTDFEVTDPRAFVRAGFLLPTPVPRDVRKKTRPERRIFDPLYQKPTNFYDLDVLGDGHKRIVAVVDAYPHDFTPETFIDVFNDSISKTNLPPDSPDFIAVDPWEDSGPTKSRILYGNVDDRFLTEYQRKKYPGKGKVPAPTEIMSYMFTKWRGFQKGYETFLENNIYSFDKYPILDIGEIQTDRVFVTKYGKIIFVMDAYQGIGIDYNWSPIILVYQVTNQRPVDICYIMADPSFYFDKYKEGSDE